jgi:6-phosphogluconolactonase
MSVRAEIHVLNQDASQWAAQAADVITALRRQAVAERGRFLVALSGGRTPEQLYHHFALGSGTPGSEWESTRFFFSDERCVPPDHSDSNFHLADQALFRPLKIPADHIRRMKGEHPNPDAAAREYEGLIRSATNTSTGWPRLDVVLLGVGNDGHTASLFPGTAALQEERRCVTVGEAPSNPRKRLTLTLGVINHATVVVFLATGNGKAAIVQRILEPQEDADRQLPAALVRPEGGRLIWLLDGPAAAKLTEQSKKDRLRPP